MHRLNNKRDVILDATLDIMAKNNTTDITIREIAKQADINVAAINYYFKSKEQLLLEVQRLFNMNYIDAFSVLSDNTLTSEQKLKEWLNKAINYALKYPGILVVMRDKYNEIKHSVYNNLKKDITYKLNQLQEIFQDVFKLNPGNDENKNNDENDVEKYFIMFLSSTLASFFFGNWIEVITKINTDEENHKEYIDFVFNNFHKFLER
jgi:AcrR family transcriptional regulator